MHRLHKTLNKHGVINPQNKILKKCLIKNPFFNLK